MLWIIGTHKDHFTSPSILAYNCLNISNFRVV